MRQCCLVDIVFTVTMEEVGLSETSVYFCETTYTLTYQNKANFLTNILRHLNRVDLHNEICTLYERLLS
jgi:hypothetical protein